MSPQQFQTEVASAYSRIAAAAKQTGKTPHEIATLASKQLADDPQARSIIAAAALKFPADQLRTTDGEPAGLTSEQSK